MIVTCTHLTRSIIYLKEDKIKRPGGSGTITLALYQFIVPKSMAFYDTAHFVWFIWLSLTVQAELPRPLLPWWRSPWVYVSTKRRSTSLIYASAFTQTSVLVCNRWNTIELKRCSIEPFYHRRGKAEKASEKAMLVYSMPHFLKLVAIPISSFHHR